MPRKKICNQTFFDFGFICSVCKETTKITMPIEITSYIKQSKAFIALHTAKGCNKEKNIEMYGKSVKKP